MAKVYFGDTESLTKSPTRIWLWGIKDYEAQDYQIGTNFDQMMVYLLTISKNIKKIKKQGKLPTIYFYNLAWDGDFYLKWLVKNGFGKEEGEIGERGYFETSITEMGTFHSIKIYLFEKKTVKKGKDPITVTKVIELKDCSHLMGGSIKKWGEKLGMPKGDTPLYESLPENYQPTESEIEYLKRDIDIEEKGFMLLRGQGMKKDTQASNALLQYKKMLCNGKGRPETKFRSIFPILEQDFQPCYRGGWTFCNPMFKGKENYNLYWQDVVSMYPHKMKYKRLPYGVPVEKEGYIKPKLGKLYIYDVEIDYRFKAKIIPFIRLGKNDTNLSESEFKYPKEFSGTLQLTEIDLRLIQKHAKVTNLKIIKTYEFKSSMKLFSEYVDYWFKIKAEAEASGDAIMLHIAKIMLNSLYGKFGTKKKNILKKPYLKGEKLAWKRVEAEEKETVYMPVACFITAYSREQLVNACEAIGWEKVYYGDTDSIFSINPILENVGDKLGNWGNEVSKKYGQETVDRCTFFETKRYCVSIGEKSIIKCAGMNRKYADLYSYDNFVESVKNNKPMVTQKAKSDVGGKILQEIMFTPSLITKTISVETYLSD